MIEPPIPWRARAASSTWTCERLPSVMSPARAQHSDPRENTPNPSMNMRLRPNMSPSRPAVTKRTASAMVYALMTHCRSLKLAFRSRWIVGSATLTTVTSSSAMKRPKQVAANAHHLRGSSAGLPIAPGCSSAADVCAIVVAPPGSRPAQGRPAPSSLRRASTHRQRRSRWRLPWRLACDRIFCACDLLFDPLHFRAHEPHTMAQRAQHPRSLRGRDGRVVGDDLRNLLHVRAQLLHLTPIVPQNAQLQQLIDVAELAQLDGEELAVVGPLLTWLGHQLAKARAPRLRDDVALTAPPIPPARRPPVPDQPVLHEPMDQWVEGAPAHLPVGAEDVAEDLRQEIAVDRLLHQLAEHIQLVHGPAGRRGNVPRRQPAPPADLAGAPAR